VLPRHERRSPLIPATVPARLLRLEGLAVAAGALALYFDSGFGWLPLVLLVLAPDLSMIGYLGGPRLGALAYDAVHTYVGPITLGAAGVLGGRDALIQVALIWLVHLGVDRLVGYGLKYPEGFRETHLQRV
jgi:hypothetical protein